MPAKNRKKAKAGYISAEAGKNAQAVPLTAKNKQLIAATKKKKRIVSQISIKIHIMGWVHTNRKLGFWEP